MKEYTDYLEKKAEELKSQVKELNNSDRKDEANLLKVQINVYNVCKTVFDVFKNIKSPEALKNDYIVKLDEMCSTWNTNLIKARNFDDIATATVEELKIQAINDAKNKFKEYWSE